MSTTRAADSPRDSPQIKPEQELNAVQAEPDYAQADEEDPADISASAEQDRASIKDFVSGLRFDEIKNGEWFAKLLTVSLATYEKKVDWKYFQDKYKGVPADAIVDQRIKLATRYAGIEGGMSAAAYTGAVVATLGTAGGASPILVPTAVATIMVDVAYLSQLQLRLAYDVAVLYRVPLDLDDPEDLWKLIRVAFTIKGGELAREGVIKFIPALVRPLVKKFFSGAVLTSAKSLPVVGRFLLQRNVIKVGIPGVGIPLGVLLNRWTTVVAGRHARSAFRNEARVIEVARRVARESAHVELTLWTAWVAITADGDISDDEALLMRHLTRIARERHGVDALHLADVIEVDMDEFWARFEAESEDLDGFVAAASAVASIDGEINDKEQAFLDELELRCGATSAH